MSEQSSAYQTLVELAQKSLRSAKGLPAQVDIKPHWSGVGFSLMGNRFVAPMGEIAEMLEVPAYTSLPGVQSWVRGVANVRGRLLPLFDLAAFFGERLTSHRKVRRILVLETEELYSGLMVDQVFGMQHFPVDTFTAEAGIENLNDSLLPFVSGSYQHNDKQWTVFSPGRLSKEPRFVNAADD